MEFEVALYEDEWFVNGYVIKGNKESGYEIYADKKENEPNVIPAIKKFCEDFESAMVWCFNS